MITVMFSFFNEKILVTVNGNNIYFSSTAYGAVKAPIDGLRLDYTGVCKEFPDLEAKENWEDIAIARFKKKLKSFDNDEEKINYIIEDLRKFGYVPEKKQREGFRPVIIK